MHKIYLIKKKKILIASLLVLVVIGLGGSLFYRKFSADVLNYGQEPPVVDHSESTIFQGRTVDKDGKTLAGVQIVLGPRIIKSDDDGSFFISGVTPGAYELSFGRDSKALNRIGSFDGSVYVYPGNSKSIDFILSDTNTSTTPEPPTPPEPPADEQPGTVALTANSQASSLNISSSSDVALSWNASVSTHQCSLTQLVYDQSDEKTEVLGDKTRGASGSETISGLKYPAYFRVFCAKTLSFGSDNLPQANDKTSSSDVHVSIQSSDPNPGEVTLTANNLADTVIIPVGGGVQLKWNYISDGTGYTTCRLTQTVPVSSTQTKTTIIADVASSGTKTMTNINTETTYTIACGRGMATSKVRIRF